MLDLLSVTTLPTVTYLAPSAQHAVIDAPTRPIAPVVFVAIPVASRPVVEPVAAIESESVDEAVESPLMAAATPVDTTAVTPNRPPAGGRHRKQNSLPPLMTPLAWLSAVIGGGSAITLIVLAALGGTHG